MEPRTILCVCTSGVGNAIMFTPVIANLKLRYPGSRLFFMGSPSSVQVASGADSVDGVVEYNIRKRWRVLPVLRRLKPDVVVVSFSDRGIFVSLLALLSGARIRAGFVFKDKRRFYNRPLFVDGFFEKHELAHNLDLCRILDVPVRTAKTFFALSDEDERFAAGWLADKGVDSSPLVGLHPGSNPRYRQKRWPAERFGELARTLVRSGFAVAVFGGSGEEHLYETIRSIEPEAVSAVGVGLKRSAAILKRCAGFVANDSGFMHMAYTFDVPVLGIFGPTPEARYRPLGTSAVVTAAVNCRPCYRGQKRIECDHVNCMKRIDVDKVADEFFRLLERANANKRSAGVDKG